MPQRPHRPPSLRNLKKTWYAKLKESGFDDIEYAGGTMRVGHPRRTAIWDPFLRECTEEYFSRCTDFLNTYEFRSHLEKAIWEYHSNGLSVREISETLKKLKIRTKLGKSHDSVWRLIKKLETEMKKRYLLGSTT